MTEIRLSIVLGSLQVLSRLRSWPNPFIFLVSTPFWKQIGLALKWFKQVSFGFVWFQNLSRVRPDSVQLPYVQRGKRPTVPTVKKLYVLVEEMAFLTRYFFGAEKAFCFCSLSHLPQTPSLVPPSPTWIGLRAVGMLALLQEYERYVDLTVLKQNFQHDWYWDF